MGLPILPFTLPRWIRSRFPFRLPTVSSFPSEPGSDPVCTGSGSGSIGEPETTPTTRFRGKRWPWRRWSKRTSACVRSWSRTT
eukprot:scaffold431_cov334-Pavlova_lutheri.AAC.79